MAKKRYLYNANEYKNTTDECDNTPKHKKNTVKLWTSASSTITAPTFSGDNKEKHPKLFLKEMHTYLKHK